MVRKVEGSITSKKGQPDEKIFSRVLIYSLAMLVGAQGNVPVIQSSAKAIAEAMPLLIAGAKRAAQKSDDDGVKQVRLFFNANNFFCSVVPSFFIYMIAFRRINSVINTYNILVNFLSIIISGSNCSRY
jgi:hypothetical protein